jgi:hypothetical protein
LLLADSKKINAQGNLLLFPRRIVFDGSQRIQTLNLANIGKDSSIFVISLIQIRMKEDGSFENITEPDSGQYFATKYLRVFPRSVTLAPKESQTIKIQLTQTGNLQPGEYRSHLYFRALPPSVPAGEKEAIADSSSLTIKLVPVFGISIPAIIQIGENTSRTSISNISIDLANVEKPKLSIYLNRSGNMSVYGDLRVDYVTAEGKKIQVGLVNGIAVYTPLSRRKIKIDLVPSPEVDFHKGNLHVQYLLPSSTKANVLSEQNFPLL